MEFILISVTIAFVVTFYSIPIIIRVAELKKLVDEPDERKVHALPVPSLGGIGIFAGFILAMLIALPTSSPNMQYYAAAALVVFFVGLKDDIIIISPLKKFLGQLLAAFIIIQKGHVQIKSLYGFLGIYNMPEMFSVLFTYLTVIVIINAFNLIDGIDGLAGTLGMLSSSIFGIYFYLAGEQMFSVMGFSLAGALGGFLIFNYSPAKIFMGDTGSLLIGLINAILVLKFIEVGGGQSTNFPIEAAPAIGFSILMVPLFDTLRMFGYRILHRRSPFSPDRNHIHHLLLDRGYTHSKIVLLLTITNLAFVVLTFFCCSLGNTWLLLGLISTGFTLISLLIYFKPHQNLINSKQSFPIKKKTNSGSKIISLSKSSVINSEI